MPNVFGIIITDRNRSLVGLMNGGMPPGSPSGEEVLLFSDDPNYYNKIVNVKDVNLGTEVVVLSIHRASGVDLEPVGR